MDEKYPSKNVQNKKFPGFSLLSLSDKRTSAFQKTGEVQQLQRETKFHNFTHAN